MKEVEETAKARDRRRTSKLEGQSARKGRVFGKVRVILDAKKIAEFNDGEILVTVMTSPDYISGIRKSSAIVTDEGGITCHAAVIARELGIPCVTSTKIATKVLKDGDMVEVDADKGIVKIIDSH